MCWKTARILSNSPEMALLIPEMIPAIVERDLSWFVELVVGRREKRERKEERRKKGCCGGG